MQKIISLVLAAALSLCAPCVFASGAAAAADWGVADLLHILSQQKSRKAQFIEKKYIAALQEPLESSGELSFVAPDHLEKRITKPKPEAVILDGNKLLVERQNGRKISLSLNDRPEVVGFVESIRATLVGDRAALEQFYRLNVSGSAEHWQLTLEPLQPQMLKIISAIHIGGARDVVESIEFMHADGDRTLMSIKDEGTL